MVVGGGDHLAAYLHAESLMGVDLCLHLIIMIGLSGVGGHCVADGNAHTAK